MLQVELVRLVLATALLAGGATAGVVALEEVHQAGVHTLAKLQTLNEDQLLLAARIAYEADGGPPAAAEAVLVLQGYLSPAWAYRRPVDTAPISLPEVALEPAVTAP